MTRKMLMAQFLIAGVAFAQAPSLTKAPIIKPNHMMACPAGTKQVGGVNTNLGAVGCMKFATTGLRLFHGPMISFYGSGKVEAVGQAEEGFRTGKWSFFDEAGQPGRRDRVPPRRLPRPPRGVLEREDHDR